MFTLEQIEATAADQAAMEALPDRVVFQTSAWLDFLAETQSAERVVAAVMDGSSRVGFFTGLVLKRLGIRILGSPFPGWTTMSMGFSLEPGVPRAEALAALPAFAFGELGCLHLEVRDRELRDPAGTGFEWSPTTTYEIDLTADEAEMLKRMSSPCRRNMKQAEKNGLVVEEAHGEAFADEYYEQLVEVFGKQGLRPTYGPERVRALIRHVEPSGDLLLLRTRDAEGRSLATGIFPGRGRVAFFWGGASRREYLKLRPNEILFVEAMRRWKARGVEILDTGGGGEYKLKYGPRPEVTIPHFRRARVPGLLRARNLAERVVRRRKLNEPTAAART